MPRKKAGARRTVTETPPKIPQLSQIIRRISKRSRFADAFVPEREILSPLERSEIGVKRLREAVVAVRASKGEKASY